MPKRRHLLPLDPLTALMRARFRHLLRGRTREEQHVLRLMPLLWSARFRTPPFDIEAPGVTGGLRRSRWGKACEQVGLRAPLGMCSSRPLVASLLLLPAGNNLELFAMPVAELNDADRTRLSKRLLALQSWLSQRAPRLALSLGDPGEPLPDAFWSMGALISGQAPRPLASTETGAERALDRVCRAQEPWGQTMALLVSADTPPYARLLQAAAGTGAARALSAPMACLAAGASDPSAQRLLDAQARSQPSTAELVASAREVRAAALRAMRQLGRQYRGQVRPFVRALGLDSKWPMVLREQLRAATDAEELSERVEERGSRVSSDAVPLSLAGSWVQARLEALPAVNRNRFGPSWAPVGPFLDDARGNDALLVVLAGKGEMSLWVQRGRRSRARARLLPESELLAQVARVVARGAELSVHALPSADRPLAATLTALAAAARSGVPSALELGDALLVLDRHRVHSFPADRFLSRPRRVRYLPRNAEELASLKPPRPSVIPVVHAHVFEAGPEHVHIYYLDASGSLFREKCERASLEAHLLEGQQLLRDAGAVLSVTVSREVSALGGKQLWPNRPTAELSLTCRWPRTVRFSDRDETLGWQAAAQTVLSHWPVGVQGRVKVGRLTVEGPRVTPLTLLWLRSHALKRLERHLLIAAKAASASLNPRRARADEQVGANTSFAQHPGERHAVHSFQHRLP
ncbi:MAG: hypothetical protein QM723_18045 [Myxococcaceae bacterium]